MSVEIALETPLANALNAAILPKLLEVGWGSGGSDDAALSEYIILMLVNGKTQEQIAADLAKDLLNLSPDDPAVLEFAQWLFQQIHLLNAQINGGSSDAAEQNAADQNAADAQQGDMAGGEMDTDMGTNDVSELNAPTGPRSMRNGTQRGGREKRMLGHMSKAMDRTSDNVLHRVRGQTGNERINTHGRAPPTGPRGGMMGRQQRNNTRGASIQAGLAAGMGPGGPQGQGWMMQGQQPNQMELVAMLEQQNQMMFQLSQQLMHNGGGQQGHQRGRGGKSLFDRVHDPHNKNNHRNRQQHAGSKTNGSNDTPAGEGEDVDMSGEKREPQNPEETVCKYNLHCTNKDCKFVHQSPAAPPGTNIDMENNCSFGAACKNRKCVGRHPSPAQRTAHQHEQECKFFPNCQNPRCTFKHPSMPLCRNGADCTTEGCKFTHVKTKCRFNPCLNPKCAFQHDEGQQGGFKDKVWTAEGTGEHVSERKFVDDQLPEELVTAENEMQQAEAQPQAQEAADMIG